MNLILCYTIYYKQSFSFCFKLYYCNNLICYIIFCLREHFIRLFFGNFLRYSMNVKYKIERITALINK